MEKKVRLTLLLSFCFLRMCRLLVASLRNKLDPFLFYAKFCVTSVVTFIRQRAQRVVMATMHPRMIGYCCLSIKSIRDEPGDVALKRAYRYCSSWGDLKVHRLSATASNSLMFID